MTYDEVVKDIAKQTGLASRLVRDVLEGFAVSLSKMEIGDYVKTPLGAFSWHHLKKRPIRMANGQMTEVNERVQMRLRAGPRMQIYAEDPKWGSIQPKKKR